MSDESERYAPGSPQATLLSLVMAVSADPKNPQAHMAMANFHAENGNFDEAARCLKRVLHLDPDCSAARNDLGLCLHGMGRDVEAEQVYRELMARDASYAPVYENLGLVLRALGRNDEALEVLHEAVKRKHHCPSAFYGMAQIYHEKNQPQKARFYADRFMNEALSGPNQSPELLAIAVDLMRRVVVSPDLGRPELN